MKNLVNTYLQRHESEESGHVEFLESYIKVKKIRKMKEENVKNGKQVRDIDFREFFRNNKN